MLGGYVILFRRKRHEPWQGAFLYETLQEAVTAAENCIKDTDVKYSISYVALIKVRREE